MSIQIKIPKDLNKIDVNNLGELIWWSNHLAICPEKILSIIDKVGINARAVKEFSRMEGRPPVSQE